MSKDRIKIIWLEPKTSKFVKEKIIDTIPLSKVKSGQKVVKNSIVRVRFRQNWYKAKVVSKQGRC